MKERKFNQDLEILKVNIMSDQALGWYLAKVAGLVGAIVSVLVLWYQVRFPTPPNNPVSYFDPWYYLGTIAFALIGLWLILKIAVRPYQRTVAHLDRLIEHIANQESVGTLSKPRTD